jgi:CBS domain-containing protein
MKVKEVMQRDVVSIKPDDNAYEALKLLFKMEISGLPVIDSAGKLVGMFTEKEVLSHTLPSYIEKVGRFVYEENPKSTRRKFEQLSGIKVGQLMRKDVVTTNEETTLCEVARIMLTQKARRLPVLNKEGKVAGIIARGDIVKALVKEAALAPKV